MAVVFNGEDFRLKYLFVAHFEDGQIYQQTLEDVSQLVVPTEERNASAFTDVLELCKQKKLLTFSLVGEGHNYTVDLRDGHFEIDSIPFVSHEEDFIKQFNLLFYRQHQHDFTPEGKTLAHRVKYVIGWESTVNGKNYKHLIHIA